MKKVRILGRTAAAMLILCIVLWNCTGCREKETEELHTLVLEEDGKDVQVDDPGCTESEESPEEGVSDEKVRKKIFVYVCGAVNIPGVYELDADARMYEAIECAGGVREDAAEECVNLAQVVVDGERIYIPTEEEAEQGIAESVQTGSAGGNTDEKVNINTASKEELKTLNGIGDSKAESIIAYREANGAFQSIEELMNVEGIKDGVFNKIKDRITVNAGS